jgi:hypothetical protein
MSLPHPACASCACRFYARLTELRNRIRANSMELLSAGGEADVDSTKGVAGNKPSSTANNPYGSLPRFANARHLPTLPETGPLVRSVSLKDNSQDPPPLPPSSALPMSNLSKQRPTPPLPSPLRRANSAGCPATPLITDLLTPSSPLSSPSSNPDPVSPASSHSSYLSNASRLSSLTSNSSSTSSSSAASASNNKDSGTFKVPTSPLDLWYVRPVGFVYCRAYFCTFFAPY